MSNKDNNKPGGKPGQRNRKAARKPDQRQSPKPYPQDAGAQIDATVASTRTPPTGAAAAADTRSADAAIAPIDNPAIAATVAPVDCSVTGAAIASAETVPVSLQTIATAYGDYTKKSFEETKCFVEKLSGARSLDKAVEIDCYPDRQDLNVELLKIAREHGTRISLGTDAHHPWQLEFIELGLAAALRAKIPADRILNFIPVLELKAWAECVRGDITPAR